MFDEYGNYIKKFVDYVLEVISVIVTVGIPVTILVWLFFKYIYR
jgi:hypothetical protein